MSSGWRGDQMKTAASNSVLLRNSQAGTPPPVILLVEDESIVREVTREVLEHAGYHVLPSCGPEEALRLAKQHEGQIGLLLTDVIMPGMNGADLAERLQSMRPDLITVFMSGYAESDVVRNMRRQAVIHIEKPFTVEVLLSRIAEALGTGVRSLPAVGLPDLSA
jgi:CheY-like chemotaxis protein